MIGHNELETSWLLTACSGVQKNGSSQTCTCPMMIHRSFEHGIPCVMLIHGGFWKAKYGLELMKPIAEDLAEAGVAAWNIEFKRWSETEEGVWMDTLSDVLRAWGQLALLPGIDIMRSMVMGHSAEGQFCCSLLRLSESPG